MSDQKVLVEDGVIAGNIENKYDAKNPIVRRLMRGFLDAATGFVEQVSPATIHEVGCGEGYLSSHWVAPERTIRGSDFSEQVIAIAKRRARELDIPIEYEVKSVYDLEAPTDSAELVVCCEVLEHLEDPHRALEILSELADPYLLVSVPREPIWRSLNMARLRYLPRLGNTPGHIQHWSATQFVQFLCQRVDVIGLATPLPWTMALCKRRD